MQRRNTARAQARSIACHWTLACGLLVLVSLGISVAALVIALSARQEHVAYGRELGSMIATNIVDEYVSNGNGTTPETKCLNNTDTIITTTTTTSCICEHYGCREGSETCNNGTSYRMQTYCKMCQSESIRC